MDAMEVSCILTDDSMLWVIDTFQYSLRLLSSYAGAAFAEYSKAVRNVKPVGGVEPVRVVNSVR